MIPSENTLTHAFQSDFQNDILQHFKVNYLWNSFNGYVAILPIYPPVIFLSSC